MILRAVSGRCLWIACTALLLASPVSLAQAAVPAAPQAPSAPVKVPEYDVVSVKPNKSGSGKMDIWIDDGNFTAVNVSLKKMILSAWGIKDHQVVDLPKWSDSARFDIRAKIIEPDKNVLHALTPEQFRSMQQPILTDRFQLKFHRETRVLPVYELVVAKGGPKLKDTSAAEMNSDTGVNGVKAGDYTIRNTHVVGTGDTMASFAEVLSGRLDRIVVDKTGLTDKYNIQLSWTSDDAGPPAADSDAPPDIYTALQEQLGLKLEPGKAEEEVFVVDHVEMPAED